ncbi:MAG: N-acetylmuramoyl-L-alanine amidase [Paludibacter sp.]|jgi:hypothetical protein|nr:N-acetylmuramoyl-L-alanine amidase [Paludibacter sp.]
MKHLLSIILISVMAVGVLPAASPNKQIADTINSIMRPYATLANVSVLKIDADAQQKTVTVTANEILSQYPFRPENITKIKAAISSILASKYPNYSVICISNNKSIDELVPNFYRKKSPARNRIFSNSSKLPPVARNLSKSFTINSGLQNRHIALWQSHGRYFNRNENQWTWQRAPLFQTVEDMFTQTFVLPYLTPMLENAGAYVFIPRERDFRTQEIIVDNDDKRSDYAERKGKQRWKSNKPGFANPKEFYTQGENPFVMGSYAECNTVNNRQDESSATWTPNFPETGDYALYISYKTLANSSSDALYTVFHSGGKTEFCVNQTMSGSTWLYLGTFRFEKGKHEPCRIELSNYSASAGKTVTADGIKLGGGMGNIARNRYYKNPTDISLSDEQPRISGFPRFAEGARYWLQWAGMPEKVYSRTQGENDYIDDYTSRANWVNYLAGGSAALRDSAGLNVPLDLSLAFHTDAGTTYSDSIVGTLAICTTVSNNRNTFANGSQRMASHDLADIVQSQIVDDLRRKYNPAWTRRGLWDKSYYETRAPEIPAMLLELLAHQNFADMRYGLDPRFRFDVSRAVYKGILKFIADNNNFDYVVQPLPVNAFSARFTDRRKVELRWHPTPDSLETTAAPTGYVVYSRIDNADFDNGQFTADSLITLDIDDDKIYSFRITAVNAGGESFPSEVLSIYRADNARPEVLIVNAFDKLSAPASTIFTDSAAGFNSRKDAGVAYRYETGFIGTQYEFEIHTPFKSDRDPGYGGSLTDNENSIIAGNTFDYPFVHGKAIRAAGVSFVSCSKAAVLNGDIDLKNFHSVDLILGIQKKSQNGNGKYSNEFQTFPLALQRVLTDYCNSGGNIFVSGAHIASDFYIENYVKPVDKRFMQNVLHYSILTEKGNYNAELKIKNPFDEHEINYYNHANSENYHAATSDAITAIGLNAQSFCYYADTGLSAGIIYAGQHKVCALAIPFEVIKSDRSRNRLMRDILKFFEEK